MGSMRVRVPARLDSPRLTLASQSFELEGGVPMLDSSHGWMRLTRDESLQIRARRPRSPGRRPGRLVILLTGQLPPLLKSPEILSYKTEIQPPSSKVCDADRGKGE